MREDDILMREADILFISLSKMECQHTRSNKRRRIGVFLSWTVIVVHIKSKQHPFAHLFATICYSFSSFPLYTMNFQVSQKRIRSIRDLHHSKNYEIQNRRIEDSVRSDLTEHSPFEHVDASLNMRRRTSERDIKRYVDSKIAKQTCSKAPKVLKELDGK